MSISALLRNKDPKALYDDIEAFFASEERFEGGLASLSYANGLMTAVIAGPEFIPPKEWLPLIVDLSDKGNIEDAQLVTNLVMLQYNKILDSLRSAEGAYEPFFWEDENGQVIAQDWAQGFVTGVRLRFDAWTRSPDTPAATALALLSCLRSDEVAAKMRELDLIPEEVFGGIQDKVPELVRMIYDYWQDQGGHQQSSEVSHALRHTGKKAGRNDPCPCGSGKKYKKCCLN